MSKQIELEIIDAVLNRHLKAPLEYLCIEVSKECEARGLGYKVEFDLTLRDEIIEFLREDYTVESMVSRKRGVDSCTISMFNPEVIDMRTHILETMIARRKS